MSAHTATARVLVPVGMIGGGFPEESVFRARELGAHVIAVDGGSTDSGPHFLGAGVAKTARGAVRRDLRLILLAAKEAGIPVIVGSCGTSGTDSGVDWLFDIASDIATTERLHLRVARIYSEQNPQRLRAYLDRGAIHPLSPPCDLTQHDLDRCARIVGVLGHEPIAAALDDGADLVLAGRATDTALIAAVPLRLGLPPGPIWHGAKITECGGLCTTVQDGAGVLITFDAQGFTVEPLDPDAACTPMTVAAHMLYENRDPFRMREPSGTLDASAATYTALDDRRVRVEGSQFEPADQYTTKLEGAAPVGYQTSSIVGIRDPQVLASMDRYRKTLLSHLEAEVINKLGLSRSEFHLHIVAYGHDALAAAGELQPPPNREVGLVFTATAADQQTASEIAHLANPVLLHAPLPEASALPSYAMLGSPAEFERGQIHEFVLNHAVDVDTPDELFRTRFDELGISPAPHH